MTTKTTDTAQADNDNDGWQEETWAYAGPRWDEADRKLRSHWYALDDVDGGPGERAQAIVFSMDKSQRRFVVGHVYKLDVKRKAGGGLTARFAKCSRQRMLADDGLARAWQIAATGAEAVQARARNDDKMKRESRSYDPDNRLQPWRDAWMRARSHAEKTAVEMQLLAALRDIRPRD